MATTTIIGTPRAVQYYNRLTRAQAIRAGAKTGVVAGLIMVAVAMLHALATQMGFFLPLKQISATLSGVNALVGGFWTVALGLGLHVIVAGLWGALFGYAAGDNIRSPWASMAIGVGIAFIAWLVMSFAVLPIFDQVMAARIQLNPGWWFLYHMTYGLSFGLAPLLAASSARTNVQRTDMRKPMPPTRRQWT